MAFNKPGMSEMRKSLRSPWQIWNKPRMLQGTYCNCLMPGLKSHKYYGIIIKLGIKLWPNIWYF